ncbi:hypothetical protein GCM10028819_26620 [Spirosoma humi]
MREHAFVFVLKGKKIIFRDGGPITIGNDELLIVRKGVHEMTEYLAEDHLFEALVIYFNNQFINHLKSIDFRKNNHENTGFVILPKDEILDSFILQYLNYLHKNENDTILQQIKVAELIYLLVKKVPKTESFFASLLTNGDDLDILMETLYKGNYTIEQLAIFSNRSLATFKRDFKKHYQTTPAKWILDRKLSDAREALINTDKNISDIAHECGFESLAQFDKSFRKAFTMTPSYFRKLTK